MKYPYDEVMRLEAARRRASRGLSRRERIEDGLEQEWYTVPEAAEELGEHPKTTYGRIRNGEIKADKRRSRKTRVHFTDLAKFMSQEGEKKSKNSQRG